MEFWWGYKPKLEIWAGKKMIWWHRNGIYPAPQKTGHIQEAHGFYEVEIATWLKKKGGCEGIVTIPQKKGSYKTEKHRIYHDLSGKL